MKKAAPPVQEAPPPLLPNWWRTALTDRNGDFDTGRILTPISIVWVLVLASYDVIVNHATFNAQEVGTGIGLILGGLAAYLWGDSKPSPKNFPQAPGAKS
ncbi:MAG: hypothetical protein RLZZ373_1080 [Pseudomonadota bacterium]|jgi:hypothetical protein